MALITGITGQHEASLDEYLLGLKGMHKVLQADAPDDFVTCDGRIDAVNLEPEDSRIFCRLGCDG